MGVSVRFLTVYVAMMELSQDVSVLQDMLDHLEERRVLVSILKNIKNASFL